MFSTEGENPHTRMKILFAYSLNFTFSASHVWVKKKILDIFEQTKLSRILSFNEQTMEQIIFERNRLYGLILNEIDTFNSLGLNVFITTIV